MRHYTKLALAGALLLVTFVTIGVILASRSTDGAASGVVTEAPPTSTTVAESVPTTTTTTTIDPAVEALAALEDPKVAEAFAAFIDPPPPLAPGCSTWGSQAEAQEWMDANAANHNTSNIDTNDDGRPCTAHFAPPPPPPAPVPQPAPVVTTTPPPPPTGEGLPAILITIRGCESGHDYTARNPRSSASGAFQFIDSTWRAYGDSRWPRAYLAPRDVQDAAALRLYRDSGTSPWNASRSCWG